MRKLGMFEEIIETGGSTVKNTAQQTVSDLAKSAKGQISGNSSASQNVSDQGTNEQAAPTQMTDDQRKQFLRDLYGKSKKPDEDTNKKDKDDKDDKPSDQRSATQKALGITPDPTKGRTPEEIAKLESLRGQLHKEEYYEKLVNPPKPPDEPVVEKLEREEKEERWELEEKKKKEPPLLAVAKAQRTEGDRGVSG